jgi:hypothetical protein
MRTGYIIGNNCNQSAAAPPDVQTDRAEYNRTVRHVLGPFATPQLEI